MVSPCSWSGSIDSLGLPPELEQRRARQLAVACHGALLERPAVYPAYGSPAGSSLMEARERFEPSSTDIHMVRTDWQPRHWLMIALVLLVAASISVGVAISVAYAGDRASFDDQEPGVDRIPDPTEDTKGTGHKYKGPSTGPVVSSIEILQQVPLIDGHNDWPWNLRTFVQNKLQDVDLSVDLRQVQPWASSPWSHTDIPRLREGHVGAQFWAAYVPCESQYLNAVQLTMEQIDVIKRFTNQYHNHFKFVTSSRGIEEAFSEGRIASLIGVEGGHSIGSSLAVLRMFYDLGVRYLTLTHNCHTPWADSHVADREHQPVHHGLTQFGRYVVKEMNRLGMLVDLAHVSVETMNDVLDSTVSPVMFSHSSAYTLCNSTRNVNDAFLKRVSRNGGIVMVNFFSPFISCGDTATLSQVADHIEHIRQVAGVDHVGLGGDFDGINRVPKGLENVSKYPDLLTELANRGWSGDDLKKLIGSNLLRVFREAEEVRDQMFFSGMTPVEETIPIQDLEDFTNCTFDFS